MFLVHDQQPEISGTRKRTYELGVSRRAFVVSAVSFASLGLIGCGRNQPQQPQTKLQITIFADSSINPNEDGTPSPVVVRVYSLKSDAAFNQADYFDLLDNDTDALGADLIEKQEVELKPGDQTVLDRPTTQEAEVIGVIAGFRDISAAQWRTTFELKSKRGNNLTVLISGLSVTVTGKKQRRLGLI